MKFTEEELEKLKKEKMEEIDRWLDNEYGVSYTRLEELHDFLIDRNMKFQDELERYKNIIDELEKVWKEQQEHYRYYKDNRYRTFLSKNLDKLKELKGE